MKVGLQEYSYDDDFFPDSFIPNLHFTLPADICLEKKPEQMFLPRKLEVIFEEDAW